MARRSYTDDIALNLKCNVLLGGKMYGQTDMSFVFCPSMPKEQEFIEILGIHLTLSIAKAHAIVSGCLHNFPYLDSNNRNYVLT